MTDPRPAGDLARAALEEGIRLFDGDDVLGAHAHFAEAYRRFAQDARILSWYGLTLSAILPGLPNPSSNRVALSTTWHRRAARSVRHPLSPPMPEAWPSSC